MTIPLRLPALLLLTGVLLQAGGTTAMLYAESEASPVSDREIEKGYRPLFNGEDLSGWKNPYSHGTATVKDGEIHLQGDRKFFLATEEEFSDFRLIVDIKLPEGAANSGVMFRCHVEPNRVYGYQAECDGSQRRWSGGLFDEGRRKWIWPSVKGRSEPEFLEHEEQSAEFFAQPEIRDALNRTGWNRYTIECRGDLIQIDLNGVEVTRLRDSLDSRGHIAIQHHGEQGQVYRFRNILIKELPEVPAERSVSLVEQKPVKVQRLPTGAWLLDYGKVAFGNLLLRPTDATDGEVTVHFGENLRAGRVDRDPPGTVRYSSTVAQLAEEEPVVIAPKKDKRNTQQSGSAPPAVLLPAEWGTVTPFRWVEIEGLPDDISPRSVLRRAAFASDWDDDAAEFQCSDELLNKVWDLCHYSIKATTFAGVYVDGDRERIPYEADAYINQLGHYYTDDNIQMARDTFDWLLEYPTWPSEWAPHMVFMAHADFQRTGDKQWLASRFDALKEKTLDDRVGEDGLVRSNSSQRSRLDIVDWPPSERDGFVFTKANAVVNAFHIAALRKMAEMASALGRQDEASGYASKASRRLTAFQTAFFDPSTGLYTDGQDSSHSSLHANLFPMAFNLVPDEKRQPILDWLSERGMQCSVYASQYYLEALFQHGAGREAVRLITAPGDRSWRHMLDRDATITWEAWGEQYKPNLDWNHAWGAAPANLLPRFVLGVEPLEPGWSRALIAPQPSGLTWARGKVPTPRGPIIVEWKQDRGFHLQVKLPPGVEADVRTPSQGESAKVFINGVLADSGRSKDGSITIQGAASHGE